MRVTHRAKPSNPGYRRYIAACPPVRLSAYPPAHPCVPTVCLLSVYLRPAKQEESTELGHDLAWDGAARRKGHEGHCEDQADAAACTTTATRHVSSRASRVAGWLGGRVAGSQGRRVAI